MKKIQKNYTEEQIKFLKENYEHTDITREELVKLFNKEFNKKMAKSSLGFVLTKYKIIKDKKYHKKFPIFYTEEKLNFLRQHYEQTDTTREELTQMFNEKFKLDKSVSAIIHTLKRYKILKDEKYQKVTIRKYQRNVESAYTKEHADFIRKNYTENPNMTRKELLKLFNEKFNLNVSIFILGYIMNRYKLRRNRTGRALIYNHEVKQFIIKCVKEGLTKQECKEKCELEFERHFNKHSIGQVANKMGLSFEIYPKSEINKYFEDNPKIEDIIRKVVKRNPESKYHEILIRDKLIEKGYKNIKTLDIRIFCESKKIKINYLGKSLEEKRKRQREIQRERSKKKKFAERLNQEYDKNV